MNTLDIYISCIMINKNISFSQLSDILLGGKEVGELHMTATVNSLATVHLN